MLTRPGWSPADLPGGPWPWTSRAPAIPRGGWPWRRSDGPVERWKTWAERCPGNGGKGGKCTWDIPSGSSSMENRNFQWVNPLSMASFNSYVKLPEGTLGYTFILGEILRILKIS